MEHFKRLNMTFEDQIHSLYHDQTSATREPDGLGKPVWPKMLTPSEVQSGSDLEEAAGHHRRRLQPIRAVRLVDGEHVVGVEHVVDAQIASKEGFCGQLQRLVESQVELSAPRLVIGPRLDERDRKRRRTDSLRAARRQVATEAGRNLAVRRIPDGEIHDTWRVAEVGAH